MFDGSVPRATRLKQPRWLDGRMLIGVVFVLVSIVVGAKVVSAARVATPVWSLRHDLAAGSKLTSADVVAVPVRLGDAAGRYVAADTPLPREYVLTRPIAAGELLPRTAVDGHPAADSRELTVPVQPGHWPADLRVGERVDVYATAPHGVTSLLVAGAPVLRRPEGGGGVLTGSGSSSAIVLSVAASRVGELIQAFNGSVIDVVRLPAPLDDRVSPAGVPGPLSRPSPAATSSATSSGTVSVTGSGR